MLVGKLLKRMLPVDIFFAWTLATEVSWKESYQQNDPKFTGSYRNMLVEEFEWFIALFVM